jgi:hypothetical protein
MKLTQRAAFRLQEYQAMKMQGQATQQQQQYPPR